MTTINSVNNVFFNKIITITSNYTATNLDGTILSNAVGGSIVITLPLASVAQGIFYNIKKIDSSGNTITITPSGGQQIDGSSNLVISAINNCATITNNGSNWFII